MTIGDLLFYFRRRLIELRSEANQDELRKLWSSINEVLAAAYELNDRETAALLEEMSDAIRDSLMGVEWKSTIPSEETIRALEKNRENS